MSLIDIIKRAGVSVFLAAAASGCTYFKNISDEKIENVVSDEKDADWAKPYYKRKVGENFLIFLSGEPFDKMNPDELVEKINTPFEAQLYSMWLVTKDFPYQKEDPFLMTSFPVTHENACNKSSMRTNDCTEAAVAAAALLNDNGYKPLILQMATGRYFGKGHTVFLYKKDGRFHTVDICYKNEKFPEGHESVIELIKKQYPQYKHYSVYDISELHPDWQTTRKNMQSKFRFTTEKVK